MDDARRAELSEQFDTNFLAAVEEGTRLYFSTPESPGRLLREDYEELKGKRDKSSRAQASFLAWLLEKLDGIVEDARFSD